MAGAILAIGLLIFLAHFFVLVFQRSRIPDVLLLMALGLVVGPGLHWVSPDDLGKVGGLMSTLALVVILFESGITITPELLKRAIRPTLALTIPTFLITALTAYTICVHALHLTPSVGWMAGAILGAVSVAVVIPLAKSVGVSEPLGTALVMESAFGDVLSIVILLGLVQAAVSGQMAPARIVGSVVASLTMAAVIGIVGGIGWLLVMNKVRQFPNTAFTTLAMVFILYGVADELGFSGAITALSFGATLTNHRHLAWTGFRIFTDPRLGRVEEHDVTFFLEVLFLLKTFFFVYLGVSIQFSNRDVLLWALVFCAVVYLARMIIVRIFLPRGQARWSDLSLVSILVPKGLVSAVLAGIPVEAGIPGAEVVREFTYMVVLSSVTLTAVLVPLVERRPLSAFYHWLYASPQEPGPEVES